VVVGCCDPVCLMFVSWCALVGGSSDASTKRMQMLVVSCRRVVGDAQLRTRYVVVVAYTVSMQKAVAMHIIIVGGNIGRRDPWLRNGRPSCSFMHDALYHSPTHRPLTFTVEMAGSLPLVWQHPPARTGAAFHLAWAFQLGR
jgi:hypothetical protein